MATEGMTSRTQLITLQREFEGLQAKKANLPLSIQQLQEDANGVTSKRNEFVQNHLRDYRKELTRVEEELGILKARIANGVKMNQHLELTSPMDGFVSGLLKRRPGEVVAANELTKEIVPENQRFVATLKIPPTSVGYLTPGLKATVTLDAYAQELRATLKGTLQSLAVSSQLDEKGVPYYKGTVSIDSTEVDLSRGKFALLSVMSLKCQILTGQRTMLQFCL